MGPNGEEGGGGGITCLFRLQFNFRQMLVTSVQVVLGVVVNE